MRNLTIDLGLRYDHFDLVRADGQVSPRVGVAYHIAKTKSVMHAAYNRLFSPPPIEYSLLASFIGNVRRNRASGWGTCVRIRRIITRWDGRRNFIRG